MTAGFDTSGFDAAGAGAHGPAIPGSGIRVSDAEREALAAELREHYAAGRLTREELDDRIDRAFAARTQGDLDAVRRDLPRLRAATPPPGGSQLPPGTGWNAHGEGAQGARQAVGSALSMLVGLCAVAAFAIMGAFSIGSGGGRPFGIALLVAAFALLRRLIFRRRGRGGGRGCGRRGSSRRR
ncbi:MAG TPA: DUF1707 domain-containing protein [Trebonia sp.]|jgi:hypothetical protein|nr:DUF1707 domain-containing protein [Trebonia sp.]